MWHCHISNFFFYQQKYVFQKVRLYLIILRDGTSDLKNEIKDDETMMMWQITSSQSHSSKDNVRGKPVGITVVKQMRLVPVSYNDRNRFENNALYWR